MEHTIAPHSSSPQEAAAEFDARFEHLTPMQQDTEQSIESLSDLQSRLTAITAEHANIVQKWASTDERHAALVQELQARVAEWRATERRLQLGEARLGAVEEELRRGLSALPQEDPGNGGGAASGCCRRLASAVRASRRLASLCRLSLSAPSCSWRSRATPGP